MNTIKSRFERFASFAFSSADSFNGSTELWDTISHYDFYLSEDGEPNENFLQKLEELGCSRSWLLYANGEIFADNDNGRQLRHRFMHGIGISGGKFPTAIHATMQHTPHVPNSHPQSQDAPAKKRKKKSQATKKRNV